MIFQENGVWKQTGIAILYLTKQISNQRDKGSHYILIKWTIGKEDKTDVNTYAPKVSTLNFRKQTLLGIKHT
jgi:hypothetical protein